MKAPGRLGLPWSFRRQIVVLTAAITAVGMLLLTLVLQVVLASVTAGDVDRVLEDRTATTVGAVRSARDGQIVVPDAALDPGVAVFDDAGALVAGEVPRSLREEYADLARSQRTVGREVRGETRLRAQPFTLTDGTGGVVVLAERLTPYEEAESLALVVSLVTGALATAAASAIAAWAVRRALAPVAEMAATASDWSEHDLTRRFALGPPSNEITALAGTLDTLLDKVATAIRSEQRLTSELAHELRTPLTSIRGTADLMLLRDGSRLGDGARTDLLEISAASQRMATTITTLLELARTQATLTAAASSDLLEVVAEAVGEASTPVEVDLAPARLAVPHALAVRTLSPVVENARHHAATRIRITARVVDHAVEVRVADDGPGVATVDAERVFEPGRTSGSSGGAGLGLAISRRIARAAGGDVSVDPLPRAGACFVVRLPLA